MPGTSPAFFKIPVTAELIQAVDSELGQYPTTPTVVIMHIPDIPRPARRLREGMRSLDNWRNIFFKQFVVW